MSAQEFRPGDRVRHNGLNESTAFVLGSRSLSAPDFCAENLTLVSRPIYPEPGQVAVLLSKRDVLALEHAAILLLPQGEDGEDSVPQPHADKSWTHIRAILDRAREATR